MDAPEVKVITSEQDKQVVKKATDPATYESFVWKGNHQGAWTKDQRENARNELTRRRVQELGAEATLEKIVSSAMGISDKEYERLKDDIAIDIKKLEAVERTFKSEKHSGSDVVMQSEQRVRKGIMGKADIDKVAYDKYLSLVHAVNEKIAKIQEEIIFNKDLFESKRKTASKKEYSEFLIGAIEKFVKKHNIKNIREIARESESSKTSEEKPQTKPIPAGYPRNEEEKIVRKGPNKKLKDKQKTQTGNGQSFAVAEKTL